MGHFLRQFPINESEGGAPEVSPSGHRLIHFRSILSTVHRVYGEPSGTHPDGRMFGGLAARGATPAGVRSTSALIPAKPYGGAYPLGLQPKLNKPEPWQT